MTITTEYKGVDISFREDREEWYVSTATGFTMDFSSKTFAKVKEKIDAHFRAERSGVSVDIFILSDSGEMRPGRIVEYLGERSNRWDNGGKGNHKVAIVSALNKSNRPSRSEGLITEYAPDTEDVREAIEDYRSAYANARAAMNHAQQKLAAIPRVTVEDISELIRIAKEQGK